MKKHSKQHLLFGVSMTMKSRKLFPTSNKTADCHDICDSTCPYGCYPYPEIDYYTSPSQPVEPEVPSNKSVPNNILPYIIISVALLASFLLLVSYYLIIVRNCSNWNRRRRSETQAQVANEEFLDGNQGSVIDHPIWYINTVGLHPSAINLITIFKYKKGDGLIDGTECSVCLNEFQDDDSLRLLSKCNHAFHIHCIDTWLRSHTNCPLCRSPIISQTSTTPVEPFSSSDEDIIIEIDINNQARDGEFQENERSSNEFKEIERAETSKKEQLKRSVSMDSLIAANISLQGVVLPKGEGERSCDETTTMDKTGSKMEADGNSNTRVQRVMESASSLKRSFSYGGRSFLSRSYRIPSSIIPL